MKRFILFSLICLAIVWHAQAIDRWQIQKDGSICWIPAENLPHEDHLEMSGQMLSVVLRYGVDADKSFHLNRSLVFPMLRMKPNKTGSNLKQRFDVDIPAMITVDDQTLLNEKVERVMFDGILRVESDYGYIHRRKEQAHTIHVERTLYPSPTKACYLEEYTFTNNSKNPVTLRVPDWRVKYTTPEAAGVYGAYSIEASLSKQGFFTLKPGEKLDFFAVFQAYKLSGEAPLDVAGLVVAEERAQRKELVAQWWENLVLDTPDTILNRMFAFAKIRGAESIYKTTRLSGPTTRRSTSTPSSLSWGMNTATKPP